MTAAAKLSKLHHDEQKQMLDAMREQGGRMTAARAEKVTKGESDAPVKRMRNRKDVMRELSKDAPNTQSSDFWNGYTYALHWILGEDEDEVN